MNRKPAREAVKGRVSFFGGRRRVEGHELTNYLFDCGLFVERRKCEKVRERVSDRGLTHPLEFRSNNETKKRGNGGHS